MNVLLLGASGMVGQGVLRECLDAHDVHTVVSLVRQPSRLRHPKLYELVVRDLACLDDVQFELRGIDACFFCIGVSASGLNEAAYMRVTYDLTLAVAETLARVRPDMTFVYVSGAGTDSSERGKTMWARVKGRTENALLQLPLKAYMLRPGLIRPLDGIVSKTPLYRTAYMLTRPFLPLVGALAPNHITTTRQVGRAMLQLARRGSDKRILEMRDINAL
ncbi:MAG: NAD(P)H-binding protein [Proteobacteria bacterium]|nr:NAD(P)H-binding protein [Pseudomonadota bacterium]